MISLLTDNKPRVLIGYVRAANYTELAARRCSLPLPLFDSGNSSPSEHTKYFWGNFPHD